MPVVSPATISHAPSTAAYWATQSRDVGSILHQNVGLLGWSSYQLQGRRTTPASLQEDVVTMTFNFCKIVGGGDYSAIPIAELGALDTALVTFMTTLNNHITNQLTWVAQVCHEYRADSPRSDDGRGLKPGPATRTILFSLPGLVAAARMADQVASTITLRTTSRKHWGRCYVPLIATTKLDSTYGRLTSATVDSLATALRRLHSDAQTAGYQLVVASQQYLGVLTPTTFEADDVPDIIRRRRAKRTNYRALLV